MARSGTPYPSSRLPRWSTSKSPYTTTGSRSSPFFHARSRISGPTPLESPMVMPIVFISLRSRSLHELAILELVASGQAAQIVPGEGLAFTAARAPVRLVLLLAIGPILGPDGRTVRPMVPFLYFCAALRPPSFLTDFHSTAPGDFVRLPAVRCVPGFRALKDIPAARIPLARPTCAQTAIRPRLGFRQSGAGRWGNRRLRCAVREDPGFIHFPVP